MTLDYVALAIMIAVALILFYGVIVGDAANLLTPF